MGIPPMVVAVVLVVSFLVMNSFFISLRSVVISDATFNNLHSTGMRGSAFAISQCTRFKGAPGVGNCTNSQFQVRNITINGLTGSTVAKNVASLQCSAVAPCTGISLFDIDLQYSNGTQAVSYLCDNAVNQKGFECTGKPCVGGSSTGEC